VLAEIQPGSAPSKSTVIPAKSGSRTRFAHSATRPHRHSSERGTRRLAAPASRYAWPIQPEPRLAEEGRYGRADWPHAAGRQCFDQALPDEAKAH